MTFTFGLQKILDFQEMQEDEARSLYEQLNKKLMLHSHVLIQLEHKIAEEEQKLYGEIGNNPNMLWVQEQYIQSLKADLAIAMHYKKSIEADLNKQQLVVVELAQKTKTMDILKTKRKEKFEQGERYKEQQMLDEMTTIRFKNETH